MYKGSGGSHSGQVDECMAGESLCAMSGAAVVDEHRAGASLSAWSGRVEAKLDEHWAGLVGWGHRGIWSELVALARETESTKNGTHQHHASKEVAFKKQKTKKTSTLQCLYSQRDLHQTPAPLVYSLKLVNKSPSPAAQVLLKLLPLC